MKRLFSAMLCIAMLVVMSGCNSTPNFKKVYDQLTTDGYKFNYTYVEMEEGKGRFYTLKVLPEQFTLKESFYLYFNVSAYSDEKTPDYVIATVYHAQDGEIYGVNASDEQRSMISSTCFVNYDTMEAIKGSVGSCSDKQIESMKAQKENIEKFLEQYGLGYDDLSAFYEWYAKQFSDSAKKA